MEINSQVSTCEIGLDQDTVLCLTANRADREENEGVVKISKVAARIHGKRSKVARYKEKGSLV